MKVFVLTAWCLFLGFVPYINVMDNFISAMQLEQFIIVVALGYLGVVCSKRQFARISIIMAVYYLYILVTDVFINNLLPYLHMLEVGILYIVLLNQLTVEE